MYLTFLKIESSENKTSYNCNVQSFKVFKTNTVLRQCVAKLLMYDASMVIKIANIVWTVHAILGLVNKDLQIQKRVTVVLNWFYVIIKVMHYGDLPNLNLILHLCGAKSYYPYCQWY